MAEAVVMARRSVLGRMREIADSALVWSSVVLCLPAFPLAEVGVREFASRCDHYRIV